MYIIYKIQIHFSTCVAFPAAETVRNALYATCNIRFNRKTFLCEEGLLVSLGCLRLEGFNDRNISLN